MISYTCGLSVHTSLRVQAPLGGGNNPTSRCPKACRLEYVCELPGVRTLVLEEGVAYIEWARPLQPSITLGSMYVKTGALLVTLAMNDY